MSMIYQGQSMSEKPNTFDTASLWKQQLEEKQCVWITEPSYQQQSSLVGTKANTASVFTQFKLIFCNIFINLNEDTKKINMYTFNIYSSLQKCITRMLCCSYNATFTCSSIICGNRIGFASKKPLPFYVSSAS